MNCFKGRFATPASSGSIDGQVAVKFAFRVEASRAIGSGHLMRCLTLANAMRAGGHKVMFVTRDLGTVFRLQLARRGFECTALPSIPDDGEEGTWTECAPGQVWPDQNQELDAKATLQAVKGDYDVIVVDHYGLDARWERIVAASARVAVIDDLANRPHECSLLLDQNWVPGDGKARYTGLVPDECELLIGPQFALLQPEYSRLRPRAECRKLPIERVLVYFGAADPNGLTRKSVQAIRASLGPDVKIEVVVGFSEWSQRIGDLAVDDAGLVIHAELPSLAGLMLQADLAIGAGGATSWERLCLGLPSIVVPVADNQARVAEDLHLAGLIKMVPPALAVESDGLNNAIVEWTTGCAFEQSSLQGMTLCDGKGTERVAARLLQRSSSVGSGYEKSERSYVN